MLAAALLIAGMVVVAGALGDDGERRPEVAATGPTTPAGPTTTVDNRPPPDPAVVCQGTGDDRYFPYQRNAPRPPDAWPTLLLRYDSNGQRVGSGNEAVIPAWAPAAPSVPTSWVLAVCVLKVRSVNPKQCKYVRTQFGMPASPFAEPTDTVTFSDTEYRVSLRSLRTGEDLQTTTVVARVGSCPDTVRLDGETTRDMWSADVIAAAVRAWVQRG